MQQQARAPQTQAFGPEAFDPQDETVLRRLGMAEFLINSRGTTVMIDFPIAAETVPRLDAVLVTHSDNDHDCVPTCRQLAPCITWDCVYAPDFPPFNADPASRPGRVVYPDRIVCRRRANRSTFSHWPTDDSHHDWPRPRRLTLSAPLPARLPARRPSLGEVNF